MIFACRRNELVIKDYLMRRLVFKNFLVWRLRRKVPSRWLPSPTKPLCAPCLLSKRCRIRDCRWDIRCGRGWLLLTWAVFRCQCISGLPCHSILQFILHGINSDRCSTSPSLLCEDMMLVHHVSQLSEVAHVRLKIFYIFDVIASPMRKDSLCCDFLNFSRLLELHFWLFVSFTEEGTLTAELSH